MKICSTRTVTLFITLTLFCAIAVLVKPAGVAAHPHSHHRKSVTVVNGHLIDLATDKADPFDDAYAQARIITRVGRNGRETTRVRLKVSHIEAEAGTQFGSHVHVGPCVEGDGAAAGPHFNITAFLNQDKVVSPETEVWLDFTVNKRGRTRVKSTVDFAIPPGEGKSIVIHEKPTAPDGGAGPRLACLPI